MNKFSIQYDKNRYTQGQNNLIQEALDLAVKGHGGQRRVSGEPYIVHPIAVAEVVAGWGLDYEAVMAALMHDLVEDTEVTAQELADTFGPKVAELVDGVTKLRLSRGPRPAADSPRLAESNENLRKLLLATTKDYRVILIKLADRLHNLRTLGALPPDKRQEIARESLQVYGPLADRLGMGQLKGELEDLGFKHAQPDDYADLADKVRVTMKRSAQHLTAVQEALKGFLTKGGVKVLGIEGRQKGYYSIYKKLAKVEGDIEKIYDLVAVRIIVPDVTACYQALGIIHQQYKPLIYRIKDYIAVPKPNGYQSLHTTVFGEDGRITEIQIRTPEMHEAAEYGLAAHFFYEAHKETKAYQARQGAAKPPQGLGWVQQLSALQKATGSDREFVEGARLELFADRIFAFSPKGDLYDLPEGSTPLDFAFAVHSELGLRALGAKVNGKMVPLDSKLENRDVVEIVTRRGLTPSRDWLGFVATSLAKNRIRAWFKSESREANIAAGRLELEKALGAWGVKRLEDLPKAVMAEALDAWHVRSVDDLLVMVADGTFTTGQIIRRLMPETARPAEAPVARQTEPTGRVLVEGSQLPYTLAPCCEPVFPQPLLGYITRGRGITVHALGCRNTPADVERFVACRWETGAGRSGRLACRVMVRAATRPALILDITSMVAEQQLDVVGISSREVGSGEMVVEFGIEVPDLFGLAQLMQRLERLAGVQEVRRLS